MKVLGSRFTVALAILTLAAAGTAQAQFFDDFDSYAAGSNIAGQGGWETWADDPGADAQVTDFLASSPPNSLEINNASDIVQRFGVSGGTWYAIAQVYVPSTQTGNLYYILLNIYNPLDNIFNWSCQIRMSAVDGVVESLGGSDNPSAATLPIITDQWVEIIVEIDLDSNLYTIFYDGTQLDQLAWNVSGNDEIAAVDLFSDGSSDGYFDDVYLDTVIPVELQSFSIE